MLVSFGGAHDGPGMAAGNRLKHLEFTSVLQVNYYTFTFISVRTAKNHIESPFCHKRKLCHGRCNLRSGFLFFRGGGRAREK